LHGPAPSAILHGVRANADPFASGRPARLASVDLVRGAVMVLMALDHVRDFFSSARLDPGSLAAAPPALWVTRWVTHFCAPLFVLLAGASAYLHGARGGTHRDLARFLVVRGLWLIVLELTVVRFAWLFNVDYTFALAQVIWAIGWSMVALAGLVLLPLPVVTGFGIAMIAGHNLLDGRAGGAWTVLHAPGALAVAPGVTLFVAYPLVPWIGVMAAGYGLGALLVRDEPVRRRALVALGIALTVGFVVLRAANGYGDPRPWSAGPTRLAAVLSFLDTTKYPPSLLFLLMTLGPGLLFLALAERLRGPAARVLTIYGRVPLFYYVLHLYLIHALAVVVAALTGGPVRALLGGALVFAPPPGYGYGLGVVYLVWIGVVAALFPACRWFASVKARRHEAWLSYV
jgi:uncharacterized membrane protein